MIRMIGLDLDGTLLNDQKEICDRNIKILKKAKEQGVKIVLCSGRSPAGMQRELKVLGLKEKGQYGIGLNGAVVYEADTNQIIKRTRMKPEAVVRMVELGRRLAIESTFSFIQAKRYMWNAGMKPQIIMKKPQAATPNWWKICWIISIRR